MIDCKALFDYFRQCPYLSDMMSIAAESEKGNTVVLPQGASPAVQYQEKRDILGNYECIVAPYPSVYEDFQINCYTGYYVNDTNPPKFNSNVLMYEQVCEVCRWVSEQNAKGNFPEVGERIISIECNPFVPQTRFVDEDTNTVGYFITVRVRYVNRRQRKSVYYECEN